MLKLVFAVIAGPLLLLGCRDQPHESPRSAIPNRSSQVVSPGTPLDLGMHEGALTTPQLVEKAEVILREMPAEVQHQQEQTTGGIRVYIAQARKAAADGNEELAHNLASKAYVLARDLKRRSESTSDPTRSTR